jgi:GTPase-associated system helical domain
MTTNIFSKYQAKNLLPSIGGNDDIYNSLQDAVKTMATYLAKKPAKIPTYALVAFDNQITETEPVLVEVEQQIQTHWKMLRSQFTDMPIALYRAVILQAFEYLIADNPNNDTATIIYLTVNDVFPYINLAQQERDILTTFLQKIGDIAEKKAIDEWSVDRSVGKVTIPPLKIKTQASDAAITEAQMKAAIYVAGIQNNNYNSSGSLAHNWVESFFNKAAPDLTSLLNTTLSQQSAALNINITTIETELNAFFKSLKEKLDTALDHNIQSAVAVEQRSQLLWWKETMYSRKLRKSYRKLSKLESVVAMAIDLYCILPNIYPISVDYILREAFWQIHGHENNEITLLEFLNEINDAKNAVFLKQYFEETAASEGRNDLVSFLERVIYAKMDLEKELPTSIGIDPSKKMTYEDISVWILHCFSVHHLTRN